MVKLFAQNKKVLILTIGVSLIFLSVPFYVTLAQDEPTPPGTQSFAEWCGCVITIPGPPGLPDLKIPDPNPVCWFRCIAGYIISLPVRIIFFILAGIFGIGALIAGIIYGITVVVLNWLIGIIMSVPVIPGKAPGIIEIGWDFSRQFANMFFILALAFIGLATILRIKEYEAKKALPTLIIIALLINFTPVIVGFVVDMGNLVTKFFLDNVGNVSHFSEIISLAAGYLPNAIKGIFTEDGQFLTEKFFEIMGKLIAITVYGLVLLIFFSLAAFIYFLIAAVFFCRTLILWVLMILSPIAFLSKIFPNTRTTKMIFPDILHWDKWWEKLIQWTIIGIPISFFLFLSQKVLESSSEFGNIFGKSTLEGELQNVPGYFSPGVTDEIVVLFGSLLAPILSLMILAMGALISFKAVPEGAKGIMRFTTEKGTQAAGRVYGGIRRISDAYYTTRRTTDLSRGRAFLQVMRTQWGERPWRTWPWQRGPQPPPQQPSAGGAPPATGTPPTTGTPSTGPSTIIRAEETEGEREGLTGEERLERRQRLARGEEVEPLPSTPPTPEEEQQPSIGPSRAARARRLARDFFIVEPLKIGMWAGTGILKATKDSAISQVQKELKVKTKTCPNCGETNIPTNKKFCPECGHSFS